MLNFFAASKQVFVRRWGILVLAALIVLAGGSVALWATHRAQADTTTRDAIHLSAPQITVATSTDVETLRAADGHLLWRAPYDHARVASGSGFVLVQESNQAVVHLLDGRNGKVLWTRSLIEQNFSYRLDDILITPQVAYLAEHQMQAEGSYQSQVLVLSIIDGHVLQRYREANVMHVELTLEGDLVLLGDHSYVGKDHTISLSALSAKDGTLRWRYSQVAEHFSVLGISGDALIVRNGGVMIMDMTTGKLRWQTPYYVYGSTTCIAGNIVYVTFYASGFTDPASVSGIAAYRLTNGQLLWQHKLLPQYLTYPQACTVDAVAVTQRAVNGQQTITYWVRASDGNVLSQLPVSSNWTTPVIGMPSAFITTNATSIALNDAAVAAPKWQVTLPALATESSVFARLADDKLYVTCIGANTTATTLYVLDPLTGKIAWQRAYDGNFPFGLDG